MWWVSFMYRGHKAGYPSFGSSLAADVHIVCKTTYVTDVHWNSLSWSLDIFKRVSTKLWFRCWILDSGVEWCITHCKCHHQVFMIFCRSVFHHQVFMNFCLQSFFLGYTSLCTFASVLHFSWFPQITHFEALKNAKEFMHWPDFVSSHVPSR